MPVSGALFSPTGLCYIGVNRVLSVQRIAFFQHCLRERRVEKGQPGAHLGLQRDYCLLIYSQFNFSVLIFTASIIFNAPSTALGRKERKPQCDFSPFLTFKMVK